MNDADVTEDVFQRGRFTLIQPKKGAHRAGLDALLLASMVPQGLSGHAVDFGAGAGAIGFAVAAKAHNKDLTITLVENEPLMVACAAKSLASADNKAFADRITLKKADIIEGAQALSNAGIAPNSVDALLTNPPYNLGDMQPSAQESRAKAHQADDALMEDWFRAATGILKPKGFLALIIRPQNLGLLLNILDRRFGDLRIIPIYAHDGEDAIRIIITGRKGSRAPLHIAPNLVLHEKKTRSYRPEIDDLINGRLTYDDICALPSL